jgi:hypothetical protein
MFKWVAVEIAKIMLWLRVVSKICVKVKSKFFIYLHCRGGYSNSSSLFLGRLASSHWNLASFF